MKNFLEDAFEIPQGSKLRIVFSLKLELTFLHGSGPIVERGAGKRGRKFD